MLLGLLAAGCARGSETLVFTYRGSDATFAAAQEAADQWAACGAGIIVTREPGGIPLEEVEETMDEGVQGNTLRDGNGKPELVEVAIGAPDKVGTLAHEMGHALGLEHAERGIMRGPHERGSSVTSRECAAFRALEK